MFEWKDHMKVSGNISKVVKRTCSKQATILFRTDYDENARGINFVQRLVISVQNIIIFKRDLKSGNVNDWKQSDH